MLSPVPLCFWSIKYNGFLGDVQKNEIHVKVNANNRFLQRFKKHVFLIVEDCI